MCSSPGSLCTPLRHFLCHPPSEAFAGPLSLGHELRGGGHSGPNYLWAQAPANSPYFTGLALEEGSSWESLIEHRHSNGRAEKKVLLILAGGFLEGPPGGGHICVGPWRMSRISPQVGRGAGCKDFLQDVGEREEKKAGNRLEKFLSARHLDLILQVKQPWKGEEYSQKLCSEKFTLWWLWGVTSRACR